MKGYERLRSIVVDFEKYKGLPEVKEQFQLAIQEIGEVDYLELSNLISLGIYFYNSLSYTKFRNLRYTLEPGGCIGTPERFKKCLSHTLEFSKGNFNIEGMDIDDLYELSSIIHEYKLDLEANLNPEEVEDIRLEEIRRTERQMDKLTKGLAELDPDDEDFNSKYFDLLMSLD